MDEALAPYRIHDFFGRQEPVKWMPACFPEDLHDVVTGQHRRGGGLPHHGIAHDLRSTAQVSGNGGKIERGKGENESFQGPVWGDYELQVLAYRYQVKGRISGRSTKPLKLPVEDDNPFIIRDMSRCILYGRCVAACNEVQVNQAIDFGFRGNNGKGSFVPVDWTPAAEVPDAEYPFVLSTGRRLYH